MLNRKFFQEMMAKHYRKCLEQPIVVIMAILLLSGLALYHAQSFTFDASADSLLAEHDPELEYYREMNRKFGETPFLILTYTPLSGKLFQPAHIDNLKILEARLSAVPGIKKVTSILDVPLLRSPPIALENIADDYKSLRDPTIDLSLVEAELVTSPLFSELLVSTNGLTTAIRVDLLSDNSLDVTRRKRDQMSVGSSEWVRFDQEYRALKEESKADRSEVIENIREIRDVFRPVARIYLGGVPMITVDMIDYVEQDIRTFGIGILVLIVIALYIFFRRIRWVLIPIGTMFISLLLLVGLLGYLHVPVTVVSANFVALIAIITISFTVHLIVRYMELRYENTIDDHTELVYEAMKSKLAPSLYTALTTAVAFGSLLTSDIVPVRDLGGIMCVGIAIAFLVTYSFFASILVLLPKGKASSTLGHIPELTKWMGGMSIRYATAVLSIAAISAVVAVVGITYLSLDNRFTEYFRKGTEIRDGMEFIDRELGGTIPLDVILKFPPYEGALEYITEEEFEDDFAEPVTGDVDNFPEKYWFTPQMMLVIEKMHSFLELRPDIGKAISISSMEKVARDFNEGQALDHLELVATLGMVPAEIRSNFIDPYASPETGEIRISTRVHETGPAFSRDDLIRDIKTYAVDELGFRPEEVHLTGMMVLFNNMLNQLIRSQTSTILFVLLATLLMFGLLLRSWKLAIIGLIPNVLAAVSILAIMGFFGIPLDMMTISIAAIVIGIGVDDAIHYLHRFKAQTLRGESTIEAVRSSHATIGSALYYTSITIVVGFSVLGFSNFVPTVYFGLLTALAMVLALAANLTVLPSLLIKLYSVPEEPGSK